MNRRLHRWFSTALLAAACTAAAQDYPDKTAARMSAEQKSFAQVIKDANIRAE